MFDTVVKGSRLEGGEVNFVHFLGPALAVMHSVVRVTLPGQTKPSPSRDSMQLTVVRKRDGDWHGEALMNARTLAMERQNFLDDLDSLSAEAHRQGERARRIAQETSSVDATCLLTPNRDERRAGRSSSRVDASLPPYSGSTAGIFTELA
jgi:hypothetical protein